MDHIFVGGKCWEIVSMDMHGTWNLWKGLYIEARRWHQALGFPRSQFIPIISIFQRSKRCPPKEEKTWIELNRRWWQMDFTIFDLCWSTFLIFLFFEGAPRSTTWPIFQMCNTHEPMELVQQGLCHGMGMASMGWVKRKWSQQRTVLISQDLLVSETKVDLPFCWSFQIYNLSQS